MFKFITYDLLDDTMQILITFPYDFDTLLGRNINCRVDGGLVGQLISCYQYNMGVYITNFESYLPDASNPIIINIFGIVNPNFYDGQITGNI